MSLGSLRKANPGLAVRDCADLAFSAYGRLLDPRPFAGLVALADSSTSIDPSGNRYVASLPELERDPCAAGLSALFGFAEIQIGYCNGPNSRLNGLEYHKSSEVDIAVTDLVLLLGHKSDIGSDGAYEASLVECFYVAAGTALLLDPEVLHFSPCRAEESGFKSVIVLPRGTNEPLGVQEMAMAREGGIGAGPGAAAPELGIELEARMLFMRNKWLLAHPERTVLVERGAWPGIRGPNIEVKLA